MSDSLDVGKEKILKKYTWKIVLSNGKEYLVKDEESNIEKFMIQAITKTRDYELDKEKLVGWL